MALLANWKQSLLGMIALATEMMKKKSKSFILGFYVCLNFEKKRVSFLFNIQERFDGLTIVVSPSIIVVCGKKFRTTGCSTV
jgi:hypothetical protein